MREKVSVRRKRVQISDSFRQRHGKHTPRESVERARRVKRRH